MLRLISQSLLIIICPLYLNTSHVKVNPKYSSTALVTSPYLNTSHVKVNQTVWTNFQVLLTFKYISC